MFMTAKVIRSIGC